MLRITSCIENGATWLKLEGKLVGPWVEELRRVCAYAASASGPVALDLSEVSFVDAVGLDVLHRLVESGIEIRRCSRFVAELFRMEVS